MFRGILLLLGLAILHTQAKHLLKQTDFTVEWYLKTKGSRFLPLVAKGQDELLFVSFPQYATLTMKVESSSMSKTPCEIPLNVSINKPASVPGVIIKRPLGAIVLENGKIVVSLLVTDSPEVSMHEEIVRIYIVDRRTCSFDVTDLPVGVPRTSDTFGVNVIEYKGKIARFQRDTSNKTTLLLLDDTGKFNDNLELPLSFEFERWTISRVAENDPSLGYIYTAKIDGPNKNRYLVKKLNKDFEIIYEREWQDQMLIFSKPQERCAVCQPFSDKELQCTLLDTKLEDEIIVKVDSSSYKSKLHSLHLFSLRDGGAILLSVQSTLARNMQNETRPVFPSYVQHINEIGEVSEPIEFHKDIDADYKIDGFPMGRSGLCITASTLDRVGIRCLNQRKERLLNLV